MTNQSKEAYDAERMNNLASDVAKHGERLDHHENLIEKKLDREAFEPIKLIVYGLMSTIAGVVTAIAMKVLGIKIGVP